MYISKICIENFKIYKGTFKLKLADGINIIVGDNEAGKSTILEAIHLALSGMFNGKYLKNDLIQYVFNKEVVSEYLASLDTKTAIAPPNIVIEVYMDGDAEELASLKGDGNSEKIDAAGISFNIEFDSKYLKEYEELVKLGGIKTLPIEFYNAYWTTFARDDSVTTRSIPIKSALIDSASHKLQNGSDIYISRIIREFLESHEVVEISQAHRKMKEFFMGDVAIKKINDKISSAAKISDKKVELSVDLSSKNAWENSLMTYLEDVPFHFIGKGEQCIVKTKLALSHKKTKEANVILLEEPENHLSHSKLNQLTSHIKGDTCNKQILVSTHSSFVANKLGLRHLILLNNKKTARLDDLSVDTQEFFEKLSGYDTLRLILCRKAILVEGDSDELVVQKAYMVNNGGKLPIEDGIEVISVGTSFLRFLEIAKKIDKRVRVITDNDGNIDALKKKYADYLDSNVPNIKIHYDPDVDNGNLSANGNKFNYNTLEPKLIKANGLEKMNIILGKSFGDLDKLHIHMQDKKTECALKVFESQHDIIFPKYILDAITQ